jgi:hypothetical protein
VGVADTTGLQHGYQLAHQLDARRVVVGLRRIHDHLLDQRAGGFQRLRVVMVRKGSVEIAHLRRVDLRDV